MSKPYNYYKSASENRTGLFIKEILGKYNTYGMDIDSIYFDKTINRYIVIEFLHCDSRDPFYSHPHYYPFNYKKFCSLREIADKLDAELWLVNFSTLEDYKNHVRILKVKAIDYDLIESYKKATIKPKRLDYLIISSDVSMSYEQFKQVFQRLNLNAR